jgi:hypothetical protein
MDLCLLAAFPVPFRFVPFLLRRIIARWHGRFVSLDFWFPLLTLQAIDFIPQALDLCTRIPQVRTQLFDQVKQSLDQLSSIFLMDRIQVKVFKHGGVRFPVYLSLGASPYLCASSALH